MRAMSPLQCPRRRLPRSSYLLALVCLAGCAAEMPVAPPTIGVTASDPRGAPAPRDDGRPAEGLPPWRFLEVSKYAGFDYTVRYTPSDLTFKTPQWSQVMVLVSGVAAGDYDGDGFTDLFVVHGDNGSDMLFRNRGDGTFTDMAAQAGLTSMAAKSAAPLFADVDGDGRLDLLIGGIEATTARLMRNRDGATFEDITAGSGLEGLKVVITASMGDYDVDGDLDLGLGRWGAGSNVEHLFRGDGAGHFVAAGLEAGMTGFGGRWIGPGDFSFTPTFIDLDDDGRPDITWSSDFGTSQYFMNRGTAGKDAWMTMRPMVIKDRNGMGTAIGDYDNDGRLDWFVSAIFNYTVEYPPQIGNRLYRNIGGGNFDDVTEAAGVKDGGWGWGTCFQDFNNDGLLDLFEVNGYSGRPGSEESLYTYDTTRLFVANGDGTFTNRAAALGVADKQQGRGIVCFDYDLDGDIDVFIANSEQPPLLYRNELSGTHWLEVRLAGTGKNREGIGARIYATVGGTTQMRFIRAGSNFASQDPALAHFGLGKSERVEKVRVAWPDGVEQVVMDVAADQRLLLAHP